MSCWSVDLQQSEIAFGIDCENASDWKDCSGGRMNFRAICAFKHVTVGDDAIGFDKEAAAARQLLAARVVSLDGDCGRLNASNQIGKKIL